MIKKLRQRLLEKLNERARQREFEGFSWALGTYFDRRLALEDLEAYTSYHDGGNFDTGVERAIVLIRGIRDEKGVLYYDH